MNSSAIEQRANGALAPDLHQMTQKILAMRTHLALEDCARADTLLLTLDRLQRCGRTHTATRSATQHQEAAPALQREVPTLDTLQPLQPSHYLVHFYSHDHGDLERVALTDTLCAAAQVVHTYLLERPRPLHTWRVTAPAVKFNTPTSPLPQSRPVPEDQSPDTLSILAPLLRQLVQWPVRTLVDVRVPGDRGSQKLICSIRTAQSEG